MSAKKKKRQKESRIARVHKAGNKVLTHPVTTHSLVATYGAVWGFYIGVAVTLLNVLKALKYGKAESSRRNSIIKLPTTLIRTESKSGLWEP